jgi:hypothetical protein
MMNLLPDKICKLIVLPFAKMLLTGLLLNASTAYCQYTNYTYVSADQSVGMELSRNENAIDITVLFNNAEQIGHISIEKSAQAGSGYTQCRFIAVGDPAYDNMIIVRQTDVAPGDYRQDVFYRVKTFGKDGITHVYPAVRFPGYKPEMVSN